MDNLTIFLTLLVGGVVGVLLAVLVDTWYVRRWHSAVSAGREQLTERLRERTVALGRAEARLVEAETQLEALRQEKSSLLRRVENLDEQLDAAKTEKQSLQQQTAVAEVEMKHVQADLAEAQEGIARLETLEADKQALTLQLAVAEKRQESLQSEIARLTEQAAEANALRESLKQAESRLQASESRLQKLGGALDHAQTQIKHTGKDQLLIINGIGPTYARRLKDAGIVTVADLARQTPERLREILRLKTSSLADPTAWIAEAQALAPTFDEVL